MEHQSTTKAWYVYVLCRPNGKPFYVGKGSGRRVHDHEMEARSGHVCQKCNTIRKIWRLGGEVLRYIVFTTDDEQEAFDYERTTIALYGRTTLANRTDGGDGSAGPRSSETKTKIGASSRARWQDPEHRARVKASVTATYADPARRAEIAAKRDTPDRRAKHSAAMTGRKNPSAKAPDKAKPYIVIAPDGKRFAFVSLHKFCLENDLSYAAMIQVANGKQSHYHGWKCRHDDGTPDSDHGTFAIGHEVLLQTRRDLRLQQQRDQKAARRPYVRSAETRAKMSTANLGRRHTVETRAKMSVSRTGRRIPPEVIAKITATKRATVYVVSTEQRARQSASHKGKKASEETRKKMSDSHKSRWAARRSAKKTEETE